MSGGTDNHQLTIDVSAQGITGSEVATVPKKIGVIVNKNGIPYDKLPPQITSGIRIGTPALTSRGMLNDEMELIGNIISEAIFETSSLSTPLIFIIVCFSTVILISFGILKFTS